MIRRTTARDDNGKFIEVYGCRPLPIHGIVPTPSGVIYATGTVQKIAVPKKIEIQTGQIEPK
jgi:hypothetical protein